MDFTWERSGVEGLLIWTAVEKRTTQTVRIAVWIFTKGFPHRFAGSLSVFEWNLSRKGWFETKRGFGENINESMAALSISFLTNQSQEKLLHLSLSASVFWAISQAICHLTLWTLHLPRASWFFYYYFSLLWQFSGASSINVKTLQWSALNLGWCELCHWPPLNARPTCQAMDIRLAMP